VSVLAAFVIGLLCSRGDVHQVTPPAGDDGPEYHALAKAVLATGHFDSTYRPPGYPAFVAGVYRLFGPHPFAVYVAQCFLFAVSLLFVAGILGHITSNRNVARMSALLCAVYPLFYTRMVHKFMTEALALFGIALFLFLLLEGISRPASWKTCAAGVAFVVSTFTKAVLLPFALPAGLFLALQARDRRAGVRQALVFWLVIVFCLAPWTYRNWRRTGAFLPVSTGSGVTFWIGNYPDYDRDVRTGVLGRDWPHLTPDLMAATTGMTEVQRDAYLRKVALGYIRQEPARALGIFCRKFMALWLGAPPQVAVVDSSSERPFVTLGRYSFGVGFYVNLLILTLAVAGALMLDSSQRRRAWPVWLLIIYISAVYTWIISVSRYGFPFFPYLLGFAAVPLTSVLLTALRKGFGFKTKDRTPLE
jgi:hypothetical protein